MIFSEGLLATFKFKRNLTHFEQVSYLTKAVSDVIGNTVKIANQIKKILGA